MAISTSLSTNNRSGMFNKIFAIFINLSLLYGTMFSAALAKFPTPYNSQAISSDRINHLSEYNTGSKIGRELAFGCSIFIGTVIAIGEPVGNPDKERVFAKIDMAVDEWLWNAQTDHDSSIEIYKAIQPETYDARGPWSLWEDVNLSVGRQLLVVLRGENMRKQRVSEGKASNLAFVLSKDDLFPAIRETLVQHARYVQNPNEIENAPERLKIKNNFIFSGYLVSYLDEGTVLNDRQVFALIKLLGNDCIPTSGWSTVSRSLIKAMSREYNPLSNSTRNAITEALIVAASSDNLRLAKEGLTSLAMLNNVNHANIKPFMNNEQRHKLIENYRRCFGNNNDEDEINIYSKFRLRLNE
jgi:hypothetical protein